MSSAYFQAVCRAEVGWGCGANCYAPVIFSVPDADFEVVEIRGVRVRQAIAAEEWFGAVREGDDAVMALAAGADALADDQLPERRDAEEIAARDDADQAPLHQHGEAADFAGAHFDRRFHGECLRLDGDDPRLHHGGDACMVFAA